MTGASDPPPPPRSQTPILQGWGAEAVDNALPPAAEEETEGEGLPGFASQEIKSITFSKLEGGRSRLFVS